MHKIAIVACVCLLTASWAPDEACQHQLCCFSQTLTLTPICEACLSQTQLSDLVLPIPCVPNFAISTLILVFIVTSGNPGEANLKVPGREEQVRGWPQHPGVLG